jgi:hypothetical protein
MPSSMFESNFRLRGGDVKDSSGETESAPSAETPAQTDAEDDGRDSSLTSPSSSVKCQYWSRKRPGELWATGT